MRVLVLLATCAAAAAAASNPQIKVVDGKLLSVVDGEDFDHGDMASKTVQASLAVKAEAAAAKVRRNGENVADLMKEIILSNKAVSDSVDGMADDVVLALKEFSQSLNASGSVASEMTIVMGQDGSGSSTEASGYPWNPVNAKSLQDSGDEMFRVTFPQGMELIAEKTVDMYQCKFTLLDAKNKPTKDVRWSAKTHADTPRTFKCVTPQWNAPGSLPKSNEWKTVLSIWENDREMPAPKNPSVFTWNPSAPKTTLPETLAVNGGKTGNTFAVDFNLVYPYGAAGYEEVEFAFKPSSSEVGLAKVTAKDAKSAARTLQFYIKTSKKLSVFKLLVTATSKSTKMRSVHTIAITFRSAPGLDQSYPATSCMHAKENGGTKNGQFWVTDSATKKVEQVYCNQEDHGGGWQLLMRNKKGLKFHGQMDYWTSTKVLNTGNPNSDMNQDAKYAGFNTLPISELFVKSELKDYSVLKCEVSQFQGSQKRPLLWQMKYTTQSLSWVKGEKLAMAVFGGKKYKNWCGRGGTNQGGIDKAWRINGYSRTNFIMRLGTSFSHNWGCGYGNDRRGISTGAENSGFGLYDRTWAPYKYATKSAGIRHAHDYGGQKDLGGAIFGR